MDRIVIVGHSIAGLTVGDNLRRLGFTGTLTYVGAEDVEAYSRPSLSKAALAPGDGGIHLAPLPRISADTDDTVELLGRRAVSLDTDARTVLLDDGTSLPYDGLVIATGSRARHLTDSPREFTLRSLADAERLRAKLLERPRVTFIGGGPLGMEVASAAVGLGCEVTLLNPGVPLSMHLGPLLGGLLTTLAEEAGVRILDTLVDSVAETADGMAVTLPSGEVIESDIVFTGIGDDPAVDWLADSGLLADGRLIVDSRQRVPGHPGIVAAGDVCWLDGPDGPRRSPVWTSAIEQGRVAADGLLNGDAAAERDHPFYFWTDQWGVGLKVSGSPPREDVAPEVVKGSLEERAFVIRWPEHHAAAALDMRMPIPRLHRLAAGEG
ncbi:FAD-dependent pyridine nucleotide-disulfide oxidoreductase [Corynebacterium humireducens NBRC 106098 = DSM 45392]|uniref:FAD-dependent pyridine nucleotide-disulfide oxidoreductase n=1 Tax=Corynebacterium humireducens NBRC 106098 = DSM 45392 TaxID=1223515 RepID=A0A0B5D0D0_9CORY|nr:FAD-dependent oxidoreductase [Corynebacterium humireducens]AJE32270.1 FAD-dependent pyridine nucleotide-disulfide oxidoreductase [Corynebacterium humireducens NBRC 106098 = DSM 45392]